jgi:hypothetical protein
MIYPVVIGYFLQRSRAKERMHLRFEAAGKEAVDVVIAVVGKDKPSVLYISMEMFSFLCIELHQLVTADVTERVLKDVGTIQVDDLFLQIDGEGGILYQ